MTSTNITITKNFKSIVVGAITELSDKFGNPQYFAESYMQDRVAKGDFSFTFWTKGGAALWLELVGLVEEK